MDNPLPRGKNQMVLVVDDEEAIRTVASDVLAQHGYRVVVAENGEAAAAVFSAHAEQIELVLTDLDMPVMDGHRFVRVIKQMNPDLRVIVSTGRPGALRAPSAAASLEKLPGVAFLDKPYTISQMLHAVGAQLSAAAT